MIMPTWVWPTNMYQHFLFFFQPKIRNKSPAAVSGGVLRNKAVSSRGPAPAIFWQVCLHILWMSSIGCIKMRCDASIASRTGCESSGSWGNWVSKQGVNVTTVTIGFCVKGELFLLNWGNVELRNCRGQVVWMANLGSIYVQWYFPALFSVVLKHNCS